MLQKYNNVFFQSLQDSLLDCSVLSKCKRILSFAGPWFCFRRFVSYLSCLFFVLVVSLVSVVLFRLFRWFCFACFGDFVSFVSVPVSFRSFRFVVSDFSTCQWNRHWNFTLVSQFLWFLKLFSRDSQLSLVLVSVKYLYLTLLQNSKGHFIILKITLLIPGFSTENQNYSILTDRIPSNFSVLLCTKNLNLAFFPLE